MLDIFSAAQWEEHLKQPQEGETVEKVVIEEVVQEIQEPAGDAEKEGSSEAQDEKSG